jgi:hypothetical protein
VSQVGPLSPPDMIRAAFARASKPKRFLEIEGGHYSARCGHGADDPGDLVVSIGGVEDDAQVAREAR